jgi:hypothetical protein
VLFSGFGFGLVHSDMDFRSSYLGQDLGALQLHPQQTCFPKIHFVRSKMPNYSIRFDSEGFPHPYNLP